MKFYLTGMVNLFLDRIVCSIIIFVGINYKPAFFCDASALAGTQTLKTLTKQGFSVLYGREYLTTVIL